MSIKAGERRRALNFYTRTCDLLEIMPEYELAAWRAWETENVNGSTGSSDWPGLDKYRPYLAVPIPDPRRYAVPQQTRQQVLERDGYTCRHCGTQQQLTMDHIQPVIHGGGNGIGNLQVLCKPCNSRKGAQR